MNIDVVDRLIQIAFLEGVVRTRGSYEQVVLGRKSTGRVSGKATARLIHRLENELRNREAEFQLPITIGGFLKEMRSEHGLTDRDVSIRLKIPKSTYRLLELDGISPLQIDPQTWRSLMSFGNLSVANLERMIRSTCTFRWLEPSVSSTLARYARPQTARPKALIMQNAARELLLKSRLVLPAEEGRKVDALIERIVN